MADAPADTEKDADKAEDLATAQLERFSSLADKILERADLAAKTLAGLGSGGLTAIGVVKVTDIYPFEGPWGWLFGLFGGFLIMGLAFVFFTRRLWLLQSPIVMVSTPWEIEEIAEDMADQKLVEEVYDEIAKLNDVSSLRAYEARAHRLARVAQVIRDEKIAEALKSQAYQISLDVRATLARARLNIVRRRATRSILGPTALLVYLSFLVGLVLFGVAADALEAKRSGETQAAKNCGDAFKAGATQLPSACDAYAVKSSGTQGSAASAGGGD